LYAKRGRLRFSSHRDFQRALERALRRVEAPMAYSAGFTPHPKVSYANAAPTGTGSEAEYLEIGLARRCDPEALRVALDASLPDGLDVLEIVESGPGGLVERLEASWWRLVLREPASDQVRTAVSRFLGESEVMVERMTKQGIRTFDARAAVVRLSVSDGRDTCTDGSCAILDLVVRHTTPAVRPDDVLAALRVVADFAPASPPLVTRLAQGPLDEENGTVADPLAPDRNLAAT
jgi:radical SAM-linked protein